MGFAAGSWQFSLTRREIENEVSADGEPELLCASARRGNDGTGRRT
jgi:hypothetical protein